MLGEIQVLRVFCSLVEHDDRFEQRRRRDSLARSVLRQVRPVAAVDVDQEVGHAPAGVDRPRVREHRLIGQQTVEVVPVRPDVPPGTGFLTRHPDIHVVVRFHQGNVLGLRDEGSFRCVGAEIAIRQLRGQQALDVALEFRAELAVACRQPGERGGMQPLAQMLALPGMDAGPALEAVDEIARLRHVPQAAVAPQVESLPLRSCHLDRVKCSPPVHAILPVVRRAGFGRLGHLYGETYPVEAANVSRVYGLRPGTSALSPATTMSIMPIPYH